MSWKLLLATHVGAGVLGMLITYYAFPKVETVEKVKVQWKTKVVTKEVVKWKTKFKERIVTKPDGTCTITRIGSSSSRTDATSTMTGSSTATSIRETTRYTSLSRYSLGLQATWEAATEPLNLSHYRLSGSARIGNLPVFFGVWSDLDFGTFGVSVTYEF
jgi:hypothetical protein